MFLLSRLKSLVGHLVISIRPKSRIIDLIIYELFLYRKNRSFLNMHIYKFITIYNANNIRTKF